MLYISDDGTIQLTRGDTARLSVGIENELTNEPYAIRSGDILTFSVKKTVKDSEYCFQKKITGTDLFKIEPEDTSTLAFGDYKYDIQIDTEDGDRYTVLGPATFKLLAEVTTS